MAGSVPRTMRDENRFRVSRVEKMARFALLLAIALLLGAPPIAAQDALPETPRELRDFRLDPERAQPQPEPQVTPPPVVPTLPETQTPAPSGEEAAPPAQRQTPAGRTPSARPSTAVAEQAPAPETEVSEPAQALPLPVDTSPEAAPAVGTASEPASLPWWQIAAALGVVALALFGFLAFRRRRSVRYDEPVFEAAVEPLAEPAVEPDHIQEIPQAPVPAMASVKLSTPPPPAKQANVSLEFIPDKATLSFTSLTVKGQLRLINNGDAPAKNLRLRATLLSANARQQQIIAAFHAGQIEVPDESLGEAKPGETLALQIEMAVPLAELQSFEVDNKRIMVPVFVADLAYESSGQTEKAKIACLVGKETQPPASKMAPFRIDLGPRSFAPLGQRPIYA